MNHYRDPEIARAERMARWGIVLMVIALAGGWLLGHWA